MSSSPTFGTDRTRSGLLVGLVVLLVAVVVVAANRGRSDHRPEAPARELALVRPDAGDEVAPGADGGLGVDAPTSRPTPHPTATALPTAVPTPTPIPLQGTGTFSYASGNGEPIGRAPHRPYAVAAEDGAGVDPDTLAELVESVLADRRSWIADGASGFVRVEPEADPDFTIVVATPETVDQLCAPLQTLSRYSCGNNGWIALNLIRWVTATEEWPAGIDVYRQYLINHEVGHYILGPDHATCPGPGAPAPIMQQQTIDLAGCEPNPWPYPDR